MSPKDRQQAQSERFKEAARDLGCDDSEERFREVMRRVAKAPAPKPKSDKANRRKPKSE